MVKTKASGTLHVLMNGHLVGFWYQSSTGATTFQYAEEWLATPGARPLSLSLPLRSTMYEGQQVYNFFDNLLPDSKATRGRMQARFQTSTNQPFDLLTAVGSDCVGAIQLCHRLSGLNVKTVSKQVLTEAEVAKLLRGYKLSPLGMTKEVDDFRISIAGAQEKTALLWHNQQWCLPTGPTPTSHIFKLPIGVIHNNSIDLRESCENEWLCLKIAEAFGLPVAKAEIQTFEDVQVLVVERFDRRWSRDGSWLLRLPQEDICQALSVAPSRKYQADGGPGIVAIMNLLLGSQQSQTDRDQFFKTQILFWLLAATDGHAKNFSIFLEPGGRYRLTPLYDLISIYPLIAKQAIPKQKAKMAMGLKRNKNRYKWFQIQPRHFLATAKAINFSQERAEFLVQTMLEQAETVVQQIARQLPSGFPTNISEPILSEMVSLARQHLRSPPKMVENAIQTQRYRQKTGSYTETLPMKHQAQDITAAFRACDVIPLKGKTMEQYYVDLSAARSKKAIAGVSARLTTLEPGEFTTILFTGHRGCGKSTELRRIEDRWQEEYRVIYLEADTELDVNDAEYTDLYLAIIRRVADELTELQLRFDPQLLKSFEDWFREITQETEASVQQSIGVAVETEAGFKFPFISRLLAKLTAQIQAGGQQKTTIREILKRDFTRLQRDINLLLQDAHKKLTQEYSGYGKGFLIIVDNLDRVPPKVANHLFLDYGTQLQDLNCTMIYTVPISAIYAGQKLSNTFNTPNIVPMVGIYQFDLERCDLETDPAGLDKMASLIEQRVNIEAVFESRDVLLKLAAASGGHVRQLMQLMRNACLSALADDRGQITLEDAIYSAEQEQYEFERLIPKEHYQILAQVCLTKDISEEALGPAMLYNTSVFEYAAPQRWNYVNPVVKKSNAFLKALKVAQNGD